MARAAAATAPRPSSRRAPAARSQAAPKRAPARRAPTRHAGRSRTAAQRGAAAQRRVSGASAGATVALPVRVLNAPFTRAVRARTGSVLDALLSGRGWIALVFVLLAGIVFFNVDLLRMNREITHMADQAAQLKRENARLREDVAGLANSERIQQAAAELGLVLPAPAEVRYLKSNPTIDARTASKRIIAPDPTAAPDPLVTETTPTTTTTLPTSTTAASPTG
jgi:cell division protein FtsL